MTQKFEVTVEEYKLIANDILELFPNLKVLDITDKEIVHIAKNVYADEIDLLIKRVLSWLGRNSDSIAVYVVIKHWNTWKDNDINEVKEYKIFSKIETFKLEEKKEKEWEL